jgi:uncharacterized HAD superfamily protein
MEHTVQNEIEKLRKQYESWMGKELLQRYHDVLMDVLKTKQDHTINISSDIAIEYVSIQQEILRRLERAES